MGSIARDVCRTGDAPPRDHRPGLTRYVVTSYLLKFLFNSSFLYPFLLLFSSVATLSSPHGSQSGRLPSAILAPRTRPRIATTRRNGHLPAAISEPRTRPSPRAGLLPFWSSTGQRRVSAGDRYVLHLYLSFFLIDFLTRRRGCGWGIGAKDPSKNRIRTGALPGLVCEL